MTEGRKKVLQMIQEEKVTVDEGMDLLKALDEAEDSPDKAPASKKRFLKVRVASEKGMKAHVNLPLNLLKVASKLFGMGMALIPKEALRELENEGIDLSKIDFDELLELVEKGLSDGKLVDVEVQDEKEGLMKVEVYVD